MNPPPFLRALAAGAMWCVATATAVTIVSQPALADRPGGPANATASACGDKLRRPPAICVTFDNTASEPVRFMAELTIDGQPVSPLTLAGQIVCDRPQTSCVASRTISFDFGADPFHIGALPKTNGKSWSINADGSGYVPPEGFEIVNNVAPGSTYCLRFRAIRASDNMWSEAWSNWACAQARSLPPQPAPPFNVSVKCFPAEWDGTSRSKPLPHRAVVTWDGVADAGKYTIEINGKIYEVSDYKWPDGSGKREQMIEIPPEQVEGCVQAKICAENVAGRSCIQTLVGYAPPAPYSDVKGPSRAATSLFPPIEPPPSAGLHPERGPPSSAGALFPGIRPPPDVVIPPGQGPLRRFPEGTFGELPPRSPPPGLAPCRNGMVRNALGGCGCPEGTTFRSGQCVHRATDVSCPPDRPVGSPPSCCPRGTQFVNGACRSNQAQCRPGMVPKAGGGCDCPQGSVFRGGTCVAAAIAAACSGGMVGTPPNCRCPQGTIWRRAGLGKARCLPPEAPKAACPPGMWRDSTGFCSPK
jgi:hypothetical protein